MRGTTLGLLACGLALGLASSVPAQTPRAEQRWVPDGAPVNCIRTSSIRSTGVVDDSTVNFVMSNTRMFTNTLPRACAGLAVNRAFTHDSRTTQLCAANSITVVQRGSRTPGTRCALGQFQPMRPAPAAAAAEPAKPAN